jgi:F0F1-type ATP synthase delta subunit
MAEPSTIARPYAAALFQSSTAADGVQLAAQLDALAGIAGGKKIIKGIKKT